MAKSKKFYSDEPHVPANKIADKPNIQNASLGNETPKMVPHNFPSAGAGAHGFGHGATSRAGHVRLSGNPSAHHVGKR